MPMEKRAYLVDDEYLVTAFVPSETACLASSPGRMSRTLLHVSTYLKIVLRVGVVRSLDLSR